MEKSENNLKENGIVALNSVSKLVQEIEKKVLDNVKIKECEQFKIMKEKCCDLKPITSISAFHGINTLIKKKILIESQAVSVYISLLPAVKNYGALVSAIGDFLLLDLQKQISEADKYECQWSKADIRHPLIVILKHDEVKSWFEIYLFILKVVQNVDNIKLNHRIDFLRPVFRHLFWSSLWRGSQLQLSLFSALLMNLDQREMKMFALEVLMWQPVDIFFCLFLQDFFSYLVKSRDSENDLILCGLTPVLAVAVKWLIVNGHDPSPWLKLLEISIKISSGSNSCILYLLCDVILDTPSYYVNCLIDVCKTIIFSTECSKYIVYKFVAVVLNWYVNPSPLANPLYNTLEKILSFLKRDDVEWNDQTSKLLDNTYYNTFGNSSTDVEFAVDLISVTSTWFEENSIFRWLMNLRDSNQYEIQYKLHAFIQGIVLNSRSSNCIELCLQILSKLINRYEEISFSHLCLLFYKLGNEVDPTMQKSYLFSLPKLAIKKENIPLIVGIIESLKKCKRSKVMTPVVIQLYLSLWLIDNRTYSYLHKMLHDSTGDSFNWELSISKSIALREICRKNPHLHAKDLVAVLSKILNECVDNKSGLPSAIAIEAVTELCKSYVIDVAGTWNAISPKLRTDKRPQVIVSLCKFFQEIPTLNSPGQKYEMLTLDIVPMLWNYTFFGNTQISKHAFRALSKFAVESIHCKLLPEIYRQDVKLPKDHEKVLKTEEDILSLPYVPAPCWIQFLENIDIKILKDGGDFLIDMLERELNLLPRGIFYLPSEKPEPLSYSYLPSRSIFRALVSKVQKMPPVSDPRVKQMIRILSHQYSKLLPPLNWSFVGKFLNIELELSKFCLTLLAKQGPVSKSAKTIIDGYLESIEWDCPKVEEMQFLYELLPLLSKSVSYDIFQNFLNTTLKFCVDVFLEHNPYHFEKILESVRKTLTNEKVQPVHKSLVAKELEKILVLIPPDHTMMNSYALCAVEFPIASIESLTSVKDVKNVEPDWLRRAISIRREIALRKDIKNPLGWLNEFLEAVAKFPGFEKFIFDTMWVVIRSRRDCDHANWLQELIWRIQASIFDSDPDESFQLTLFLIEVFISSTILLSGYDCFFPDVEFFTKDRTKKLDVFPRSLAFLLHSPSWSQHLSNVSLWLTKLSKWKRLPCCYGSAIVKSLLILKEAKYSTDDSSTTYLFNLYSVQNEI